MMSDVSSPVYGSGGGSGSAKLPSSVAYFAGEVRNNPIDWGNGGVLAVVWEPSVASTEITEDTQISGGLWATDTGLEFTDDAAHKTHWNCTWSASEAVIATVEVSALGLMRLRGGTYATFGAEWMTTSLISADISDWEAIATFVSGASGLYLSASSLPNHTNAILMPETRLKTFEVTIGATTPTNARLAFGTDASNFVFFGANGAVYVVSSGAFYSTIVGIIRTATTYVSGDVVRVSLFGSNAKPCISVEKNGVALGGAALVREDLVDVLPPGDIKFGFAYRNTGTNWYATSCKASVVKPARYMHISIDDTLPSLINSLTYNSLWDEPHFAFYKHLHDTYGACISLFCFAQGAGLDIASMTSKHKADFESASDWLKLGFHAYDINTTYNSGISAATALMHYTAVVDAIKTFAGELSIDSMPRIHTFAGTLDQCLAWKSAGATGFLAADDTRTSYYHSPAQWTTQKLVEHLYDAINDLHFTRTAFRTEYVADAATIPAKIESFINQNDATAKGCTNELIIFSHEYLFPEYCGAETYIREKLEACCAYAKANGIRFSFPYIERMRGVDGAIDLPVAMSSNAIGSVSRVVAIPGSPSASLINRMVEFG